MQSRFSFETAMLGRVHHQFGHEGHSEPPIPIPIPKNTVADSAVEQIQPDAWRNRKATNSQKTRTPSLDAKAGTKARIVIKTLQGRVSRL